MSSDKERLDVLLASRYGISRSTAKEYIESGDVTVLGKPAIKPGERFDESAEIVLNAELPKYVSRGGIKLEKALVEFAIDVSGKVCLDVGASTGGFTDCLLQNGAKLVYAVDTGTEQLAEKLKADSRVISLEKTNITSLSAESFSEKIEFVCIDVSFVSVLKILPSVFSIIEQGICVCLIKPQFEAGRKHLNKKGIVKDISVHKKVIEDIKEFCVLQGAKPIAVIQSPITGGDGNIEYLIILEHV